MNRTVLIILRLLCLLMVSINVQAENEVGIELADIEAQERQQIISELSYRLNTQQVCEQTLDWHDSGSGADLDGFFFIPKVGRSNYMIGGHASQKRRSKYHCVLTVSEPDSKPSGAPVLLVAPKDWRRVWEDSGSGATNDGSFWQAIPPDDNYRCIGSVSQLGQNKKPKLPNYRCVHKSLTEKRTVNTVVWSDQGSGADKQVTVFKLPITETFIAVAARASSTEAYNLKKDASSKPDAKTVEAILAERMQPIKADIEAQAQARVEAKLAAEEQRKAKEKRKAEEQRKVEAERKAAAAAAKEKAAAEKKRLVEAAEKKKMEAAEQANLAKAATEKTQVEEEQVVPVENVKEEIKIEEPQQDVSKVVATIEEKTTSEETKSQEATNEEAKVDLEQELIPDIPEVETPSARTEEVNVSEVKDDGPKGLDKLVNTFLTVLAILFGGLILLLVVFKLLFAKKAATGE